MFMHFPDVIGKNLNGRTYGIPNDFDSEYNLVIIAFFQEQQVIVNTWIKYLDEHEKKYPDFKYYELPTLSKSYIPMKFIITGGMRSGIPDEITRGRTITLFLNKKKFREELGIENEDTIYLYLVSREGKVFEKYSGSYDIRFIERLDGFLGEKK